MKTEKKELNDQTCPSFNLRMMLPHRRRPEQSEKSNLTKKSKYTNTSKLLKSQLFSTISKNNNSEKNEIMAMERDL